MGLFRKKQDPISERARQINDEIAALEAQIQQLNAERESAPPTAPSQPLLFPGSGQKGSPFAAPADASPSPGAGPTAIPFRSPSGPAPSSPQPRLRSTAVPHGSLSPSVSPAQAPRPASPDPVFEEVDQERLQAPPETVTPGHYNELGVRKYDLASGWQRLKNHFRGPVTSNPKLVHYLSAGSIQGLRPLRYEKRVARNRVIVLAAFLVLALWGVIAIFVSRR